MSCHISALCIALPRPKSGPVETTLGNSWRSAHPPCPFRAPAAPQPPPPPCGGQVGTPLKVGTPSMSLSSLRKRSSALIAPRVYVSETDNMYEQNSAVGWPIFRSVSTQWLGPLSRIQAALWHLWSSLRMALRVLVPTHLRKAVHASPWFWVQLDYTLSFCQRKPRIELSYAKILNLQVSLQWNAFLSFFEFHSRKKAVSSATHQLLQWPRINVCFISLKHKFGTLCSFLVERFYHNRLLTWSTRYQNNFLLKKV